MTIDILFMVRRDRELVQFRLVLIPRKPVVLEERDEDARGVTIWIPSDGSGHSKDWVLRLALEKVLTDRLVPGVGSIMIIDLGEIPAVKQL